MGAFRDQLEQIASRGEVVNTLFEERLYGLVSIVHRIADALTEENVPYELVGGLAVLIYLEAADPSQSTLTRDVDVMIDRPQIGQVRRLAEQRGFHFRHSAGLDMLIAGTPEMARNAVHLVFSGEKVREGQAAPNPPIRPEKRLLQGREIAVIALEDLIRMKLSAYRDKDRVHVRALDAAGLISAQIERSLASELQARLRHIRETE